MISGIQVSRWITSKESSIIALSDRVFDFAELGFHEEKTAACYREALENEGFSVETGIDGIPTAFKASFGRGKPVIAFLAEYDALPELSQEGGSIRRCPAKGDNPNGHGCGHNLLGAGTFGAALAVKEYLKEHKVPGTVLLFGCPSEEKGNSKTFFARDGVFDGVDAAFCWHPMDMNEVFTTSTLANVSVFFRFRGITSHAAASPELGRSALDAAELMSVGCNYLREHIIPEARIHYAYRDAGGIAPNVVQGHSCVHYFVRAPKSSQVQEILERVIHVARGAAEMTGTEMSYELYAGLSEFLPNHVLSGVMQEALEEIGPAGFDEADYALARSFWQESFTKSEQEAELLRLRGLYTPEKLAEVPVKPLDTRIPPLVFDGRVVSGSTDVGDASQVMPTAQIYMATATLGTAPHTWQMTAHGNTEIAHKGMLAAAKVMALAAIRVLADPSIAEKAKEEWQSVTGGHYLCPIPSDMKPRLHDDV